MLQGRKSDVKDTQWIAEYRDKMSVNPCLDAADYINDLNGQFRYDSYRLCNQIYRISIGSFLRDSSISLESVGMVKNKRSLALLIAT